MSNKNMRVGYGEALLDLGRTNPKVVPISEAIKDVTNLPGGPLRGYLK